MTDGSSRLVIGLGTALSAYTRWCVVGVVLDRLFVAETLQDALVRQGTTEAYRTAVRRSTLTLGAISMVAAVVAGLLAQSIVRAPAGSEAFGREVGYYTGWSFPVITIPTLVFAVIVFRRLLARIEQLTGMPWDELLPPLDPGGS